MDLIEKCLVLNPAKRLSAYEALNHRYFSELPNACDISEIPKIEKECHEYNIRQELASRKRKQQLLAKGKSKPQIGNINNGQNLT